MKKQIVEVPVGTIISNKAKFIGAVVKQILIPGYRTSKGNTYKSKTFLLYEIDVKEDKAEPK